jgi:hypothetical protein
MTGQTHGRPFITHTQQFTYQLLIRDVDVVTGHAPHAASPLRIVDKQRTDRVAAQIRIARIIGYFDLVVTVMSIRFSVTALARIGRSIGQRLRRFRISLIEQHPPWVPHGRFRHGIRIGGALVTLNTDSVAALPTGRVLTAVA